MGWQDDPVSSVPGKGVIPPLPPGFTLYTPQAPAQPLQASQDSLPPLPEGFTLDQPPHSGGWRNDPIVEATNESAKGPMPSSAGFMHDLGRNAVMQTAGLVAEMKKKPVAQKTRC